MPRCAIVIPTFDGAHLTRGCLEALLPTLGPQLDCEVVVIDDASTDDTAGMLRRFEGQVTSVRHETNQGFAEACRTGARAAAACDHLVFLNNDVRATNGWLEALLSELEEHPGADVVGAKLLFPDATIQHAGMAIGHDGLPHILYGAFPGDHPAVNRPRAVAAVVAACMLVRREAWDRLGGFDRAFHNGHEDVDFCLRLRESGREVRYCPTSVLFHLESVTRGYSEAGAVSENDRLFRERWGGRVAPDDLEHYIADGLLKINYASHHPLTISISPHLAAVTRDRDQEPLELLLTTRSRQVMELLGERMRAELSTSAFPDEPPAPAGEDGRVPVESVGGDSKPLRLRGASPRNLVSLLMPVKDEAGALRELLPSILAQQASAELEIVAVDSGSEDDTVEVLREFDARVLRIPPNAFDHGLTRNLAAQHARGDLLLFVNARTRPVDDGWLAPLIAALRDDPLVAGACSRVVPHPDADPLTRWDGMRDLSAGPTREVKEIEEWEAYREMGPDEQRRLLNFHTVSALLRADVLARMPFRSMRAIGEDLMWARDVLESGLRLVHEPGSVAYHSHRYPLRDWFGRNVDDGLANQQIVGRRLDEEHVDPAIRALVGDDWRHLDTLGLPPDDLERWRVESVLRRTAQIVGQWVGVHHAELPDELVAAVSRIERSRRGR